MRNIERWEVCRVEGTEKGSGKAQGRMIVVDERRGVCGWTAKGQRARLTCASNDDGPAKESKEQEADEVRRGTMPTKGWSSPGAGELTGSAKGRVRRRQSC